MPHEFLSDFISKLEDAGELVRISAPVDAALELAIITDRISKSPGGGPALIFENVKNCSIPVITNVLGSHARLGLAWGVDSLDQASVALDRLLNREFQGGWLDALKMTALMTPPNRFAPRLIKTAACQQVVKIGRDVNLWDLPIPRCWPDESHPVLTAAQTITSHPLSGAVHFGWHPLQVVGSKELLPHWHRFHDGYRHWQTAVRERKQLPVAISLGGDPLLTLMAAAPFPGGTDRRLFGGFLRGGSLDHVVGRSVELNVPAGAEIILEGYIDHMAAPVAASPIACHSGCYSLPDELPVIHVTAITHRANPILPVIMTGRPPSENSWISLALDRLFLPLTRRLIPEVIDWHRPCAGAGRNLLFVSMLKESPLQARRVLNALWGLGHFGQSKIIVIVDADVRVHKEEDVWFAVGAHAHPDRDYVFNHGPVSMDDHATPTRGVGCNLGIDATRKFSEESHSRSWPADLQHSDELIRKVIDRWQELGLPKS